MSFKPLFKPEIGEIIPAEWYWDVVDDIFYLYQKTIQHDQQLDCVEQYLQETNSLLKLIAPATKIKSIEKTVTTTPEPLFVDQLTTRRIKIKASKDNIYTVFIGDATAQYFPLSAGEEIDLEVRSPIEVYLRSNGNAKVFAIFEIVE